MKALIIGGGIAGLTLSIALKRVGIDSVVYERLPQNSSLGAGIFLAPNALAVYHKLGLSEMINKTSIPYLKGIGIARSSGQVLTRMSGHEVLARHGFPIAGMHRADLVDILARETETLVWDKRLTRFEEKGQKVVAHFDDNTSASGDFMVGADGIHSVVRNQLFDRVPLRYSGQTCWRMVTHFAKDLGFTQDMLEIWGDQGGLRVGMGPLPGGRVYTFVTAKSEPGRMIGDLELGSKLRSLCRNFPPVVGEILDATPTEDIIQHDLYDFAPQYSWSQNRVVLIGDAIHATTPNLGQGAGQAIESCYALASSLSDCQSLSMAFKQYARKRQKKAHYVTKLSRQMGQLINVENRTARWIRDLLLRWSPDGLSKLGQDRLFN